VRILEPFPVRRLAAVCAAVVCTYLAFADHYAALAQADSFNVGFGAPPPPAGQFVEAFLEVPGGVAGLPLIVEGLSSGRDWVVSAGLILGAAFFWYCAGSYVDRARGMVNSERPSRVVEFYMLSLLVVSTLLFPVTALAGFNVGIHSCAIGAVPFWAEVLMYGIFMFWVSLGTFFACRRVRGRLQRRWPVSIFPGESRRNFAGQM
jgi:hypothetical protein